MGSPPPPYNFAARLSTQLVFVKSNSTSVYAETGIACRIDSCELGQTQNDLYSCIIVRGCGRQHLVKNPHLVKIRHLVMFDNFVPSLTKSSLVSFVHQMDSFILLF